MDISIKDLMACEGADLSVDQSILFRFFGFIRAQVPPDPTGVASSVSLRQLAEDLEDNHIHVNVIRTGFDAFGANALENALIEIDYSIYRLRNIYRQRSLGVGRILHWFIDSADSDGLDTIADEDDARDLWRGWSTGNNGIDAFVVRSISGFLGLSPRPGDCTGGGKNDGCLAAGVDNNDEGVSRTFAHEIGHFLGLPHNHDALPGGPCPGSAAGQLNLMAQSGCASSIRNSVQLTGGQGNTIHGHDDCIRGGC